MQTNAQKLKYMCVFIPVLFVFTSHHTQIQNSVRISHFFSKSTYTDTRMYHCKMKRWFGRLLH